MRSAARLRLRALKPGSQHQRSVLFVRYDRESTAEQSHTQTLSAGGRVVVHAMRPAAAVLEWPDEINRFKTESHYADEVELATIHRVLETLRAAINCGAWRRRHRSSTSRHFIGSVGACRRRRRRSRDRRLSRDEERKLLDTALSHMNTVEHGFVRALLHARMIGGLELCCRSRRGQVRNLLEDFRTREHTAADHEGIRQRVEVVSIRNVQQSFGAGRAGHVVQ
jgi:hypothetical protein